ncbi:MAG: hypothetical protein ACPGU1_20200 [Myxococcota bacterium]
MNAPLRTAALAAALTLTLPVSSGHAIYDGVPVAEGNILLNQVMSVGKWAPLEPEVGGGMSSFPGDKELVGTTMVIKHEGIDTRCMLTAKHLKPWESKDEPMYHRVVMGADVTLVTPAHRDQLVADTASTRSWDFGVHAIDPYRDLRVLWLENRHSDGADLRLRLQDYEAQKLTPLPLDEGLHSQAYTMSGYGMTGDGGGAAGAGVHHSGDGRVKRVQVRPDVQGGGARIQVLPGLDSGRTECSGDSGTSIMLEDREVFSAMSMGATSCNPENRNQWLDPSSTKTSKRKGSRLPGNVNLHSALNDRGTFSGDPEKFSLEEWGELGNWQQVTYFVSKVCTKEVVFQVQGSGAIVGHITGEPLRAYETPRLNHSVSCVGKNPDIQTVSMGDCVEAVHQPEGLAVEAIPADGWAFYRWSDGPDVVTDGGHQAPSLCPCEGQPVKCTMSFDDVGHYDAQSSIDLSMCMAEFVRVPGKGGGGGPAQPSF